MKFRITAKGPDGVRTYTAIGDRNALMDAAYDNGALTLSIVVIR